MFKQGLDSKFTLTDIPRSLPHVALKLAISENRLDLQMGFETEYSSLPTVAGPLIAAKRSHGIGWRAVQIDAARPYSSSNPSSRLEVA